MDKEQLNLNLLEQAKNYDSTDELHNLIHQGADVNTKGFKGFTPLITAVMRENDKAVKELLKYELDINATDEDGWTALMHAASSNFPHIVKLLIDAHADVNAQDRNQKTALSVAVRYSGLEVIEFLLKGNADLTLKDRKGKTARELATELLKNDHQEKRVKILALLEQAELDKGIITKNNNINTI